MHGHRLSVQQIAPSRHSALDTARTAQRQHIADQICNVTWRPLNITSPSATHVCHWLGNLFVYGTGKRFRFRFHSLLALSDASDTLRHIAWSMMNCAVAAAGGFRCTQRCRTFRDRGPRHCSKCPSYTHPGVISLHQTQL